MCLNRVKPDIQSHIMLADGENQKNKSNHKCLHLVCKIVAPGDIFPQQVLVGGFEEQQILSKQFSLAKIKSAKGYA